MLGRLIFKTLVTISLVTALFASFARAEATEPLSMEQISDLQRLTLKQLTDNQVSNENKYDLILQQKYLADTNLSRLILEGNANPKDLTARNSVLSQAFQAASDLAILAKLSLEDGRFTENSCIESIGMLRVSAIEPGSEMLQLNQHQAKLEAVIKNLCR